MARGTPDGGYQSYSAAANQSDPGSVADRLLMGGGSVSRTGRVIWATGFEGVSSPADFQVGGANTAVMLGGSAAASNIPAWQGANFLGLLTDVSLNSQASFYKYFPSTIQTGKWGLEAMIAFGAYNSTLDFILKRVGAPSPNPTYTADIRMVVGPSMSSITLQYMDNTGTFQTLDNLSNVLVVSSAAYYNLKLVVDFSAGRYARFLLNNRSYDLSASAMQQTASGAEEKSSFQIVNQTTDTNAKIAAVDNVILTADEP